MLMFVPGGGGLILYQAYGNLYAMTGRKAHFLKEKQIPSVGVFDEVFSIWKAFGGNTRNLGSFGEETDKTTNQHSSRFKVSAARDGVTIYTRRRHASSSDGVITFLDGCIVDAKVFRKILDICPRFKGEELTKVQDDYATLTFLIDLGYKGPLHKHTSMYVDHMNHPWRTLAAIINKCLSGKTGSNDRLRKSRIDILWGMFYRENVDYPELIWEDFAFQIDHIW
ncbi:hypothetical protein Tco_1576809 [Tanacetum coccineum]